MKTVIDIQGITKTSIYQTCFLRREIIKLIQREMISVDYLPDSKDAVPLFGVLKILNRELKSMNKGIIK